MRPMSCRCPRVRLWAGSSTEVVGGRLRPGVALSGSQRVSGEAADGGSQPCRRAQRYKAVVRHYPRKGGLPCSGSPARSPHLRRAIIAYCLPWRYKGFSSHGGGRRLPGNAPRGPSQPSSSGQGCSWSRRHSTRMACVGFDRGQAKLRRDSGTVPRSRAIRQRRTAP